MPRVDLPWDIFTVRDHFHTVREKTRWLIESRVSFTTRRWRVQIRVERVRFQLGRIREQLGQNRRAFTRIDAMEELWND
jgi:hypothetical protein